MGWTKTQIENATRGLLHKIEEAAKLASIEAGRPVSTREALRAALGLGVSTLTAEREELSPAEIAKELHLPLYTVKEAAREYTRSGGRQGLGPWRQYGKFRRFPRPVIEAWKQSRQVGANNNHERKTR